MKIFVCLKEVAGRDTRYALSSGGSWIDESNVTFEISECDEYALEEALKLKEKHGAEIVILSLGAVRAEKVMRKGLAMGADRGILIRDDSRSLKSSFQVASAFAGVIGQDPFDFVLCGTQSDDLGYAQTGVMLAELLGVPYATMVMEISAEPGARSVTIVREMESGWFQRVELETPALLTIQAGSSHVRYPSLKGIMQARQKELREVAVDQLSIPEGPGLEIVRLASPEKAGRAEVLQGSTAEVVDRLVEKLRKEAKVL